MPTLRDLYTHLSTPIDADALAPESIVFFNQQDPEPAPLSPRPVTDTVHIILRDGEPVGVYRDLDLAEEDLFLCNYQEKNHLFEDPDYPRSTFTIITHHIIEK